MKPWERKKKKEKRTPCYEYTYMYVCVCAPTLIYLFKLLNGRGNQMHRLPFSPGEAFQAGIAREHLDPPAGRRLRSPGGRRAGQAVGRQPGLGPAPARGSQHCWVALRFFSPIFFSIWMGIVPFFLFFSWFGFVFFPLFHSQQVLQAEKAGIKSTREAEA